MRCFAILMLLVASSASADDKWWGTPVERVAVTTSIFDETDRAYDTPLHPRLIAGNISLSCEHIEGRPCGDGAVGFLDLDSRAGFAHWLQAATRVRLSSDDTVSLDRAHIDLHYSFLSAKLGRDVLSIGPSARTALSWGDHPPPLDQALITAHRWHVSGLYVVGRLREPQRYPGTIVTIARAQLGDGSLRFGLTHLLQLEGDGARHLGVVDFLLEHVRRKDISASATDSSNRRFGGDVSFRIPELHVRLYYVLMFEDIRKARLIDAIRYDADHLAGLEHRWAIVEYHQTAARSEEHTSRTTGFTHGGYSVGSPLGPDARSIYFAGQIRNLTPWIELVQLRNRVLEYVNYGPITPVSERTDEGRFRVGIRGHLVLRKDMTLEAEAMFEHIDDFAFVPHSTHNNAGVRATLVWLPRF